MQIQKPIIILGAPRSGTTLLFRTLALHPALWHLPGESHHILEGPLHPKFFNYKSNRIMKDDVSHNIVLELRQSFFDHAINVNAAFNDPSFLMTGNGLAKRIFNKVATNIFGTLSKKSKFSPIRLLEKTPKNCLRVPLLEDLFPDAYYLWLTRDAANNIDSLIAGWSSIDQFGPFKRERFGKAGYNILNQINLTNYTKDKWKFALVPEWQSLNGKTIADVAAWQYFQCNSILEEDLSLISSERVYKIKLEEFVKNAPSIIETILTWAKLPRAKTTIQFAQNLPRVNDATPSFERKKSRLRYSEEINAVLTKMPEIHALRHRLGYG